MNRALVQKGEKRIQKRRKRKQDGGAKGKRNMLSYTSIFRFSVIFSKSLFHGQVRVRVGVFTGCTVEALTSGLAPDLDLDVVLRDGLPR